MTCSGFSTSILHDQSYRIAVSNISRHFLQLFITVNLHKKEHADLELSSSSVKENSLKTLKVHKFGQFFGFMKLVHRSVQTTIWMEEDVIEQVFA